MTAAMDTTGGEATITRVFDAPREELWKYFTDVDLGDGKTQVTYHHVGHMPTEEYARVEEGVNGFYDRLADQVARR